MIHDERQRLVRLAKIDAVNTPTMPSISRAADVSMAWMRAWPCGASQNRGVKAAEGPNIGGVLTLALQDRGSSRRRIDAPIQPCAVCPRRSVTHLAPRSARGLAAAVS